MAEDPYSVLGVPRDATRDQIKKAYRKKVSKVHPDKVDNDDAEALGKAQQEAQRLNAAWECLGDPQKRLQFDRTGHTGEGPTARTVAESLVMEEMDKVMGTGTVDNILGTVRSTIQMQIFELEGKTHLCKKAKEALTNVREKVRKKKGKAGLNLYTVLVDQKIKHMEDALVETARKLEERREALQVLDEYEDEPPPPPTFSGPKGGFFDQARRLLDQGRL